MSEFGWCGPFGHQIERKRRKKEDGREDAKKRDDGRVITGRDRKMLGRRHNIIAE